jgi:hypothetical protein
VSEGQTADDSVRSNHVADLSTKYIVLCFCWIYSASLNVLHISSRIVNSLSDFSWLARVSVLQYVPQITSVI